MHIFWAAHASHHLCQERLKPAPNQFAAAMDATKRAKRAADALKEEAAAKAAAEEKAAMHRLIPLLGKSLDTFGPPRVASMAKVQVRVMGAI